MSSKFRPASLFIVFTVFLGTSAVLGTSDPAVSATNPTVTWISSTGQTVAGVVEFEASAATDVSTSSKISKWCLELDGEPIWSDSAVGGAIDGYAYFSESTGCWTLSNSSYAGLTSGVMRWDTTKWSNGSHTLQLTVTDTGGRSTTSSLFTFTTANDPPTTGWLTDTPLTVSETATIQAFAEADPSGTARIQEWCLRVNEVPISTNIAVRGTVRAYSTFNSATGCWSLSSPYYDSGDLTAADFSWDTTAWSDGTYTFKFTVRDTSERSTTSSPFTFTIDNPGPTVAVFSSLTDPGTVPRSVGITAIASALQSVTVEAVCIKIDGKSIRNNILESGDVLEDGFSPSTGCWETVSSRDVRLIFNLDTIFLANGTHTIQISARDSRNRVGQVSSYQFTTYNAPPQIQLRGVSPGKTVSGGFVVRASVSFVEGQTDLRMRSMCLKIATRVCLRGEKEDGSSYKWVLQSLAWPNGNKKVSISVTDSSGRISKKSPFEINIFNPSAALVSLSGTAEIPDILQTATRVQLRISTRNSYGVRIYYGPNIFSLKKKTYTYFSRTGSDTFNYTVDKLAFNTNYIFKVVSLSGNGEGGSRTITVRTGVAPVIVKTNCVESSHNSDHGYTYYTHEFENLWSNGRITWSEVLIGRCP